MSLSCLYGSPIATPDTSTTAGSRGPLDQEKPGRSPIPITSEAKD